VLGADVIGEFLTPQFRRFLITGGIAACVNVGTRMIYDMFMPYSAAIVLAYLSGMLTAYLLARRYVFTDSERKHSESSFRFAIVNVFGVLQTWLVSIALGDHVLPAIGITSHAHDLAHMAGVAAPVFTSFVAHRRWTFA
jgi:putative flippase GtrA